MTRNESRWLVLGLLLGLGIAAVFYVFYAGRMPGHIAEAPKAAALPAEADMAPQESPAAVELTEDEQRAVGIETTEAVRRTLRKEILTSGKVSEPETGLGTISSRIGGRNVGKFKRVLVTIGRCFEWLESVRLDLLCKPG